MAVSVSFSNVPSLSTLTQTRVPSVCLPGHKGTRGSCWVWFSSPVSLLPAQPWLQASLDSAHPSYMAPDGYSGLQPRELPALSKLTSLVDFGSFVVGPRSTSITIQSFLTAHIGTTSPRAFFFREPLISAFISGPSVFSQDLSSIPTTNLHSSHRIMPTTRKLFLGSIRRVVTRCIIIGETHSIM